MEILMMQLSIVDSLSTIEHRVIALTTPSLPHSMPMTGPITEAVFTTPAIVPENEPTDNEDAVTVSSGLSVFGAISQFEYFDLYRGSYQKSGQACHKALRCFSVNRNMKSFLRLEQKWVREAMTQMIATTNVPLAAEECVWTISAADGMEQLYGSLFNSHA